MTYSATLLILGGAGDLSGRLLIPGAATYLSAQAADTHEEHDDISLEIIGVGREEEDDYLEFVRQSVLEGTDIDDRSELASKLAEQAKYVQADATSAEELGAVVAQANPERRLIIYYALPPSVTSDSIDALADIDLPEGTVVAVEKPIGTDAASAADLEKRLAALIDEDHLYRVDHFLQESAVNSLIGLLALNRPFVDSFQNQSVESIDFVYDETLALEGRANFYDANGAARDMLQSHLIQAAAHVLVVGGDLTVAELLGHTSAAPERARRARYTAGEVNGTSIPSYVDEEGVDPERATETLAQIELAVDTDRWRGVPVTLRSGKALGEDRQYIEILFRGAGAGGGAGAEAAANRTRIVVDFDDQLAINLFATAGWGTRNSESLTFESPLREGVLTPYARVVRALITGDHRREVPAGTAEMAWDILQPVLDAFADGSVELEEYAAGSAGPTAHT